MRQRQVAVELDAWLDSYNRQLEALWKSGFKQTPTNARERLARLTADLVTDIPPMDWVQDDLVPGPRFAVPVRIYHPNPGSRLPVLAYFHGGGHVAGSVSVYDPICRKLAHAARHIVVSADYRRAPECPYPAAVEDAGTLIQNIWLTLDSRKIAYDRRLSVAGDSAGGALCAAASHAVQRDAGIDIHCQVLIYPCLDYTLSAPSVSTYATGYLLELDRLRWYLDNYFQGGENRRAASPLYMEFSDRLPDTLVVTAEFCPLRDDGLAYLERVRAAGGRAVHLHLDNMVHAFLNMETVTRKACEATYDSIGRFLNRV